MYNNYENNVPEKGQLIINPKTNRPIKVGSRVWLGLVKEKLVEGTYKPKPKTANTPNNTPKNNSSGKFTTKNNLPNGSGLPKSNLPNVRNKPKNNPQVEEGDELENMIMNAMANINVANTNMEEDEEYVPEQPVLKRQVGFNGRQGQKQAPRATQQQYYEYAMNNNNNDDDEEEY